MKKYFMLILSAMMIFVLSACGNSDAAEGSKTAPKADKKLVVYFSCTGNTKHLAETTANVLNADLFEINAATPYTPEDLNWHDKSSRTTIEQNDPNVRPAIANKIDNFDQYGTVVIAYPIWWGQEPRIIDTFVESYDFSNKKIVAICTSGGSELGSSVDALKALTSSSAKWLNGKRFNSFDSADVIKSWLTDIQLIK